MHEHAHARLRKGAGRRERHFLQRLVQSQPSLDLPILFALAMSAGAAWYFSLVYEPELIFLLGLTISTSLAVFLTRWFGVPRPFLAALIMGWGFSCGALSGKFATLRVANPTIQEAVGPIMVEGWVEAVEPASRGVRLRLRVHAIDDLSPYQTPEHVRLTHTSGLRVESGRFVRCWAVLRPPPGPIIKGDYAFDRQAWYEGLGAVGYVQGRCRGGVLGAPTSVFQTLQLEVGKLRRQLAHYVNSAAGPRAGGFAAALASGDRSFMKNSDQQALRDSGLAHLLAISGLHMGIVGGLIYLIVWRGLALIEPLALRITVRKPAAFMALTISAIYLILSGASVSTQRAFIMALVFFGAVLVERQALSLRSLAIAMILVLMLAPWSVLTPGYQMSFAATGALIATYQAWQAQRRRDSLPRRGAMFWVQSLVATSLVTSLATLPFALYHFDRLAGLGLLANLAAMPIISLISAPLAGFALTISPFGLAEYPLRLFGMSLEAVLFIAERLSQTRSASQSFGQMMPDPTFVVLTLTLILTCLISGIKRRAFLAAAGLLLGGAFWTMGVTPKVHWAPSGDVYIADSNGGVEQIQFLKGEGLAPLRYADEAPSSACAIEDGTCLYQKSDLTLLLDYGEQLSCSIFAEADLILSVSERPICSLHSKQVFISWSDVKTENGVCLSVKETQITKVPKPPCGERPWNPCKQGFLLSEDAFES